jgi:predicted Zn-dependent protease
MIEQFRLLLGPARIRALILLLGITGLISLVLNAFDKSESWVTTGQSLMAVICVVGAAVIVGGRLDQAARVRWLSILAPAVGAVLLGLTVLPHLLVPLAGAAAGWIVAGAFIFRPRVPREFQMAVRHLRKGEYEDAVQAMNGLMKDDPQNENYYRFRAEIFRLWGKLDRARKDYQQMIQLVPESAVGYNGLAEVHLQSGHYHEAREAAQKAYELAPEEWVAVYNLGMIEDRLGQSQQVIEHLETALRQRVPDARHRLLIHLYLARAYGRLGDQEAAGRHVEKMRHERAGLEEWHGLLEHDEAAPLRAVLAEDVQMAQDLMDGKVKL